MATRLTERETGVREALRVLTETLTAQGYKNIEISGRTKSVYSIAQKMERYREMGREFEDINDLQAVRVVVKDVQDCYGVLGIVHGMWRPLPGQFDDYIANPRESGYQSLHTTVVTPDGDPLEVQIRTVEMHETAGVWHRGALALQGRREGRSVRRPDHVVAAVAGLAAGRDRRAGVRGSAQARDSR